jgi:hypothetical protein
MRRGRLLRDEQRSGGEQQKPSAIDPVESHDAKVYLTVNKRLDPDSVKVVRDLPFGGLI